MDVREKLVELLANYFDIGDSYAYNLTRAKSAFACGTMGFDDFEEFDEETVEDIATHLIAHGVTVQECAYWQYVEDDVDEDNNIQAYCSVCHAGDKHATSMIGKVPYCWKCGRKMMPQPPKGE